MMYLEEEQVWLLDTPQGSSFEVIVAGDQTKPSPIRLSQAQAVLPEIPSILNSAIAFLESFVDRSRFATDNDWHLEGVEFGRHPDQPITQFLVFFSIEGDTYGEWSVLFQTSSNRHFPVAFSRRQI